MVQRYETKKISTSRGRGQPDANQRFLAAVSYLLFFLTGILFLYVEKKDPYIRFHAYQSTAAFGVLFIFYMIVSFIPFLGALLTFLIFVGGLVIWILLMVKAFIGEKYKLPYFGEWAERQV